MSEMILKITLAPLLLVQGLYVRWRTPVLPEAEGDRQGCEGQGRALRLLVIGDSAAAGVGVVHQRDALVGQLVSRLRETRQIHWRLIARKGIGTLDALRLVEETAEGSFDVAVVSLGVNDVTGGMSVADWITAQARLIDLLKARFAADRIILCPVPPMHAFPALPQPLRWYLGRRAMLFNARLAELIADRSDTGVVLQQQLDIAGAMRELMAEDGFHPGPAIYARWAEEIACNGLVGRSETAEQSAD